LLRADIEKNHAKLMVQAPASEGKGEKRDDSAILAHLEEIKQKLHEAEEERKELKQSLK
jgi:hypothetical protein